MKLAPGFQAASVSELVAHIKDTLEDTFHEVMVEGEVSNLSLAHSGHWYFTLSDAEAAISCALFKGDALRNPLVRGLKDGDKIIVYGPISVFQKRGTFQILARQIVASGEGQARLKFEALKKKLQGEGLFDLDRKRPLPKFPRRVAVITAPQGAALQDFLNVYRRRALHWEIVVVPALVQGGRAPASLMAALDLVEKRGDFDAVVFARGGGAAEDLSAFNDEKLVRRLAACPFPVISAVGHQVDWTLCDFVADQRCETPTAAAEMLTQPQTEILRRLQLAQGRMVAALNVHHSRLKLWLERHHPGQVLRQLENKLQQKSFELDDLSQRLSWSLTSRLGEIRHRLEKAQSGLQSLNPKSILSRGYAFVTSEGGDVVTGLGPWRALPPASELRLHWHDGEGVAVKKGESA